MTDKKTITIHFIEAVPEPQDALDVNPFENYSIVKTVKSSQSVEFISDEAEAFVWETFSMFKADRYAWGWRRLDDEYGDAEWTEHTILIPTVEMTDREIKDFIEKEATRRTQEDLDEHGLRFFDWERVYDNHEATLERGE